MAVYRNCLRLFIVIFLGIYGGLHAQPLTPASYGLKEFTIHDPQLGLIRFYVSAHTRHRKLPLFVELNGSGGLPLCLYMKGKGFGSTSVTFDQELLQAATAAGFHYVVLGKPGTP